MGEIYEIKYRANFKSCCCNFFFGSVSFSQINNIKLKEIKIIPEESDSFFLFNPLLIGVVKKSYNFR